MLVVEWPIAIIDELSMFFMTDKDMTRAIDLLGIAACGGAPDRRCAMGPPRVRQLLLADGRLSGNGPMRWRAMLAPETDGGGLETVAALANQVSAQVRESLAADRFVIAVGGDHSCAVGTWSGAADHLRSGAGRLGLIWVDAHMDSHTPASSPSGRVHGMPVAALLGEGASPLVDVAYAGAKIDPRNLCLIGIRSFEPAERELLDRLGVTVFTMADVRRLGFDAVLAQAQFIASTGTAGYGLSVDLDGIDPLDAPGVGSPVVGGIAAEALLSGVKRLAADEAFIALEIAELNPVNDVHDKTAALVLALIDSVQGDE